MTTATETDVRPADGLVGQRALPPPGRSRPPSRPACRSRRASRCRGSAGAALHPAPERWIGRKPGTYEWIPFGGGIRRCLGAALAMVEQRVVLEAMARRLDLEADDPAPERARHRNVTMIPARGARVIVRA